MTRLFRQRSEAQIRGGILGVGGWGTWIRTKINGVRVSGFHFDLIELGFAVGRIAQRSPAAACGSRAAAGEPVGVSFIAINRSSSGIMERIVFGRAKPMRLVPGRRRRYDH